MTWRDWALALLMITALAILCTAYVLTMRRANRQRDEAIHAGAVSVYGYVPTPSANANPLTGGKTLRCTHMVLSGATEASCGICGPLMVA